MMKYNLTARQKDLLLDIVNGIRNDGWGESFLEASTHDGYALKTIGGEGQLQIKSIVDMDQLVNEKLIRLSSHITGEKLFTLAQAAYDAVDSNFEIPEDLNLSRETNIGFQDQGDVTAGILQGFGYSDYAQIQQIINNPESLKEEIEKIANQLIEAVKNEVNAAQLTAYIELTKQFKEEIQGPKPEESKIKKLIAGLSFINDPNSSVELIMKTLPYLFMLAQLIQNKF